MLFMLLLDSNKTENEGGETELVNDKYQRCLDRLKQGLQFIVNELQQGATLYYIGKL